MLKSRDQNSSLGLEGLVFFNVTAMTFKTIIASGKLT